MLFFRRKKSPRRNQVRKNIASRNISRIGQFLRSDVLSLGFLWIVFVILSSLILSFERLQKVGYNQSLLIGIIVVLISAAASFYIYHYQKRIVTNRTRTVALAGLFIFLLAAAKAGVLLSNYIWLVTATAIIMAVILCIAYNQRFAIGMSIFYCSLASFIGGLQGDFILFLTMAAGAVTCCFLLKEIRTRTKLLKVSSFAAVIVFITSIDLNLLAQTGNAGEIIQNAGFHAGATLVVGMLIQSLLPLIEKVFGVATSMTLFDYSDANQPLLKRLAMEAPGTYSHSLLIGSIAESAAESIGRNGLLCRVGAYYHDIGKINKPNYFVENELGTGSRHKELSPAMSQLIIVGHVKDGIEMAKEYGLPPVLRQFIETHHGATLVEYFYKEARRRHDEKQPPGTPLSKKGVRSSPPPSENEFRYPGPKPRTKEAAIVMLADSVEGAVRSMSEITPTRIETLVHNISMKRLQDGQFDECELTLRELSQIESSISKTLAAHYHGRIAYPKTEQELADADAQKQDVGKTEKAEKNVPAQQSDRSNS